MRHTIWVLFLLISGLLCFAVYCVSLVDWVQDVQTGVYKQNRLEGVLETSAQLLYIFLGIRFVRSHIHLS